MIKRSYFMVFRKTARDGRYAEYSLTLTSKSWFADIGAIFNEGKKSASSQLAEYPGDVVFCTTFNRL